MAPLTIKQKREVAVQYLIADPSQDLCELTCALLNIAGRCSGRLVSTCPFHFLFKLVKAKSAAGSRHGYNRRDELDPQRCADLLQDKNLDAIFLERHVPFVRHTTALLQPEPVLLDQKAERGPDRALEAPIVGPPQYRAYDKKATRAVPKAMQPFGHEARLHPTVRMAHRVSLPRLSRPPQNANATHADARSTVGDVAAETLVRRATAFSSHPGAALNGLRLRMLKLSVPDAELH